MAKLVSKITLGADVSKDKVDICNWETQQLVTLSNEPAEIRRWLKTLHGPVRIAIESTSDYHLVVVDEAQALGYEVYLVNGYQLSHYRESINVRNKTDPKDAWLLARYLAHEGSLLRLHPSRCRKSQELWSLVKRRAKVVGVRKEMQQSLANVSVSTKAFFTSLKQLLRYIDRRIKVLIQELGWWADYEHCLSIPGIGPLNAAALVTTYHRGAFASANAFVAFIGFDVRLRDSGKHKGKRKLTKRGEGELRRLLYCATKPAQSYAPFDRYLAKQLENGLPKIAAKVCLARKLARIAFTLMDKQQSFKKVEVTA
ncbi:MAG TPA: IS110 family transposase [Woeseiaceae bacterium]|nr:IS110 family transposase [Woeseiaceae bacterium]